jgi:hypothetical protein
MVACRLTLGFVEAPFFVGTLFYLSKWYIKKELALRMSSFYSGSLPLGTSSLPRHLEWTRQPPWDV